MLSAVSVDLIYDENNRVQILEFGRALKAGFKGYKAVHKGSSQSDLWRKQVMPFFSSHGVPVWKLRAAKSRRLKELDIFDKYAQNYVDFKARINSLELPGCEGLVISPTALTDIEYLNIRRIYPRIGLIDGFFPLNAAFNNKAILVSAFGNELAGIMPHQRVYEKTYWENLVERIAHDFKDSERIVLKSPESSQGRRVVVTNLETFKDLQRLFSEAKKRDEIEHKRKSQVVTLKSIFQPHGLNRDERDQYSPNFIVQEFVPAKPLEVENKHYAPTMRVVFSVWAEEGSIKIHFHDAYWKLPPKPINGEFSSESAVSKITSSKKLKKRPQSAKVSRRTCEDVTHQLRVGLEPMFERALFLRPEDIVLDLLKSEDLGDILSGCRMALRRNFFYSVHTNRKGEVKYPEAIAKRLRQIAKEHPIPHKYLVDMTRSGVNELPVGALGELNTIPEGGVNERLREFVRTPMGRLTSVFCVERSYVPGLE